MPIRTLDRILQSQGFGTRRECRTLVRQGLVTVAGRRASYDAAEYELEGLSVEVEGVMAWRCRERVYLALHKPPGYECSRNPSHHEAVSSLLPAPLVTRGVHPVGRLDQDTSGLLLLSDDGAFNHEISSPKHHVPKTYRATTRAPATTGLVARLLEGVLLHGETALSAARTCQVVGPHEIELQIDQGKYHQVKRMLAAAGADCAHLHRTAIGRLNLERLGIASSQWCELGDVELALLRAAD